MINMNEMKEKELTQYKSNKDLERARRRKLDALFGKKSKDE